MRINDLTFKLKNLGGIIKNENWWKNATNLMISEKYNEDK
jgi:hypothetical protein